MMTTTYRRDEMRADAETRGWKMSDWFQIAGVSRARGYDFMRAKTKTPQVAEALTRALGRAPGFYHVRKRRAA
jgi:hypothetical protein